MSQRFGELIIPEWDNSSRGRISSSWKDLFLIAGFLEIDTSTIGWKVTRTNQDLTFEFDYIRPFDGCKIRIVHSYEKLLLDGKLKHSDLKQENYIPTPDPTRELRNILFPFFGGTILLAFAYSESVLWLLMTFVLYGTSAASYGSWIRARRIAQKRDLYTNKLYSRSVEIHQISG